MPDIIRTVDFEVDETYQTWYKVVGMFHHYLISHTEVYTTHGIPIVFYDQIGAGASAHLPHKPKEFWTFPQEFQDLVRKHEREGTTSSKEYQDALQIASFQAMEDDPTVYTTMLGTSEFNTTGTLKTWSVIDRLHTITRPTLVVNGTEEGAQDFVVAPFIEKIPKSRRPFWEDKEYYFNETIGNFLLA
ncbi:hypothetical protein V8E55_002719 [Tylopilus felleus]